MQQPPSCNSRCLRNKKQHLPERVIHTRHMVLSQSPAGTCWSPPGRTAIPCGGLDSSLDWNQKWSWCHFCSSVPHPLFSSTLMLRPSWGSNYTWRTCCWAHGKRVRKYHKQVYTKAHMTETDKETRMTFLYSLTEQVQGVGGPLAPTHHWRKKL